MTTHRALAILPALLALAACGGGSSGLSEAQVEARLDALATSYSADLAAADLAGATPSGPEISGSATYDGVFATTAEGGPTTFTAAVPMQVTFNYDNGQESVSAGRAMAFVESGGTSTYAEAGGSLNWTLTPFSASGTRQLDAVLTGSLTAAGHTLSFDGQQFIGAFAGPNAEWLVLQDTSGSGTSVDGIVDSDVNAGYAASR